MNIFRWQSEGDHPIDGERLSPRGSEDIALKVPGEHNQVNARIGTGGRRAAAGLSPSDAAPLLTDFPGLPHRLQLVAEHDGRQFYNDSKSTTPQATVLAVRSFPHASRVHLIAGGYDKKIDLSAIAALGADIAAMYTIGTTGGTLADQARHAGGAAAFCDTLASAVQQALAHALGRCLAAEPRLRQLGSVQQLRVRGEEFVHLVKAHIAGP